MAMKLAQAKASILSGMSFAEVYPMLSSSQEQYQLRKWFVHELSGLPPRLGLDSSTPFAYAGDACVRCGSLNLRTSGACKVCSDCGESQGCG